MSGAQQEKDNRSIGEVAKFRIGEFYTKLLLQNIRKDSTLVLPNSVESTQYYFRSEGFQLPDSLIEQFKLKDLNWTSVLTQDGLPLMLAGFDKDREDKAFSLRSAIATIEIPRRVDLHSQSQKRHPIILRIAGIDKDIHRVLALTYSCREVDPKLGIPKSQNLTRINVSISEDEFHTHREQSCTHGNHTLCERLTSPIETPFDRPYQTAALITNVMGWYANRLGNSGQNRVLAIHNTPAEIIIGNFTSLQELEDLEKLSLNLGFYGAKKDGIVTIGYQPPEGSSPALQPWTVIIPEKLQPAFQ